MKQFKAGFPRKMHHLTVRIQTSEEMFIKEHDNIRKFSYRPPTFTTIYSFGFLYHVYITIHVLCAKLFLACKRALGFGGSRIWQYASGKVIVSEQSEPASNEKYSTFIHKRSILIGQNWQVQSIWNDVDIYTCTIDTQVKFKCVCELKCEFCSDFWSSQTICCN